MNPLLMAAVAQAASSLLSRQGGGQQKQNFALSGPGFEEQQQVREQQDPGLDPYAQEDQYADLSDLRSRAARRFLAGA